MWRGYTILEVLLFLAISSLTFFMAGTFINGKQGAAEFRQGMNDFNNQVQTVINDVSNGFYPSNSDFSCSSSGGSLSFSTGAPGSNERGTNSGTRASPGTGCVFLGKVLQMAPDVQPDGYYVYSVAGSQYADGMSNGNAPDSYEHAQPTAIYKTGGTLDLTDKITMRYGFKATAMYDYQPSCTKYDASCATPASIGAVGFYGSLGTFSGDTLQSGSQTTTVIVMPSSQLNDAESTMVSNITHDTTTANIRPTPNIVICLENGSGRYGSLIIGGASGQRLTTRININSFQVTECDTTD